MGIDFSSLFCVASVGSILLKFLLSEIRIVLLQIVLKDHIKWYIAT